tara:strand:+ start:147033 stop:149171 length:2139 start_codon:yes stop_codon:yes gene_type:complete
MGKAKSNKTLFSIRYKFLSVMALLLFVCVLAYLSLATSVFRGDKTELVFDYNSSLVRNLGSDVEGVFERVKDKTELMAFFDQSSGTRLSAPGNLFQKDDDVVFMAKSADFKKLSKVYYENKVYYETYGLNRDYFTNSVAGSRPVPMQTVMTEGEALWNATVSGGPPLIGYARNVILKTAKNIPYKQFAIVVYLKADPLLKAVQRGQFSEVMIASAEGELLAHADPEVMAHSKAIQGSNLFQKSVASPVRSGVLQYEREGEKMLGAFEKTFGGKIFVMSRVTGSTAFAVVDQFVYRSILFAGIVLTIAFLAAVLFSRSLVSPLERLTEAMKRVSAGFLDSQIEVNTSDEISVLANSFNGMIKDLKSSRQELIEMNNHLEEKVKERTRQLEEQNQAVKEAQEALLRTTRLAAVGEIAGQAAHEVLNPLTSILSRVQKIQGRFQVFGLQESQMLKDIRTAWEQDKSEGGFEKLVESWKQPSTVYEGKDLWAEDLANIEAIEKSIGKQFKTMQSDTDFLLKEGNRINKIVNSMRSLNVMHSEKRRENPKHLIEDSIQIMQDLLEKMDIAIEFDFNESTEAVVVDSDEFTQALTNLIRNSIQAVHYRKKQSEKNLKGMITLKSFMLNEKIVAIQVQDNGLGITEQDQKKLFEMQFSTKSKEEGTGIGLSIARRFVRGFGGDLILKESTPGAGSVFEIQLPSAAAVEEEQESAHEEAS